MVEKKDHIIQTERHWPIYYAIKKEIEPTREIPEEAKKCFMSEGDGYADDFGQTAIFEQDPDKLKEMIEENRVLARRNFEAFDLDGNVEEPQKKR